jgi:uncharacterized RDD family membrane protein YckC
MGGMPMGGMPMGGVPMGGLAQWPQRALGYLIDGAAPFVVAIVFFAISSTLGILFYLAAFGWVLYNAYLGGQTGQSFGKKIAGLKLVGEATGQPIGGGLGIARWFCHIVDSLICYVGWFFPLWDAKRQTIADKIMKTVVITVPK